MYPLLIFNVSGKAKHPKGNRPVYFLIFDIKKQIKEDIAA